MKRKALVLLLLFASIYASNLMAQVKYSGKEFFLTIGGTINSNMFVEVSSKHNANVSFHYTNINNTVNYNVKKDSSLIIKLSTAEIYAITNRLYDQIDNKSLHISSDSDVIVSLTGGLGGRSDEATIILPFDKQAKANSYYLLGSGKNRSGTGSIGYSLVATTEKVVLKITLTQPSVSYYPQILVTLNKGDTYQLATPRSPSFIRSSDLSGSLIEIVSATSCFPLAVYHSTPAAHVNWPLHNLNYCCADILLEQLYPVDWWDTTYLTSAFGEDSFSIVRIISSANNNTIYYNNNIIKSLDKGEVFDTLIYTLNPVSIHGEFPIGVMQLMKSMGLTGNLGDPSSLWVNSYKHGIKESIFRTHYPRNFRDTTEDILTIISHTSNIHSIKLNNKQVGTSFSPFPADSNWQYANIKLMDTTNYHLRSPQPILAHYYWQTVQGSHLRQLQDLRTFDKQNNIYDTVYLCDNKDATLIASYSNNYKWSTGDTTQSIIVTNPGIYSVKESTDDGCVYLDAEHFFYVIQLYDDDTITQNVSKCVGDSLLLSSEEALYYKWSTGETTKDIKVTQKGIYSVEAIRNTPCLLSKTYIFNVNDIPKDTVISNSIVIQCTKEVSLVANDALYYEWSTGAISKSIIVNQPGIYFVRTRDNNKCRLTIEKYIVTPVDTIITNDTLYKCAEEITLSVDDASYYQWSTGSMLQNIIINKPGTYWAKSINYSPCKAKINNFFVKDFNYSAIQLGNDTIICDGEQIVLQTGFDNTFWSTGHIGSSIIVSKEGVYKAEISTPCNLSDEITVDMEYCYDETCNVLFPNAFSPNRDGRNDFFKTISKGPFREFKFSIYNRFGERVFHTNEISLGWDGLYKGKQAELGTYFYFCSIYCLGKSSKIVFKGDLMLMR